VSAPDEKATARAAERPAPRRPARGGARGPKDVHLQGIAVSPGIAIGRVFLLEGGDVAVEKRTIDESEAPRQVERFRDAVESVRGELKGLRGAATRQVGEDLARILDTHILLLEDEAVIAETVRRIERSAMTAEWAFQEVVDRAIDDLLSKEDEYLRDRAGDLRDVRRRILRRLLGGGAARAVNLKPNAVVVAKDLSPSDTIALPSKKVAALVSDAGGKTSHTAILARSLGIPAVVGLDGASETLESQGLVVVDGVRGAVVYRPSAKTLKKYKEEERAYARLETALTELSDLPAVTLDHHAFELTANVDLPSEIELAVAKGARGIGLYRTEFLFLAKGKPPTEEEQAHVYRQAAERMAPDKVIFRTLDLGADKVMPGEHQRERNPFLGLRGIRYSLRDRALFRAQLRAMLRASVGRNVKIMIPMVTSLEEVVEARGVCREVQRELSTRGVPFDEGIEFGIMVETPAAALLAETLAREVDFFSIGTNDLVQYVLAVDRGNERVAQMYEPLHPAVLRSVYNVVEAAHRARIWVGVCGEMASDPLALLFLVGLGIDEISTTPFMVPQVKSVIRSVRFEELRLLARALLKMHSAKEVREHVREYVGRELPQLKIYV
jgi:phosphotransferase system enzyme I (PtsI)